MSTEQIDELGPVDYLVVEFPPGESRFTGEMAKDLAALVDAGTIRVLDLLILQKNADGSIDGVVGKAMPAERPPTTRANANTPSVGAHAATMHAGIDRLTPRMSISLRP